MNLRDVRPKSRNASFAQTLIAFGHAWVISVLAFTCALLLNHTCFTHVWQLLVSLMTGTVIKSLPVPCRTTLAPCQQWTGPRPLDSTLMQT